MPYVYKPSILKSLGIPTWEQVRMMGEAGLREKSRRQKSEEKLKARQKKPDERHVSSETPFKEPGEKCDGPTQGDNQGDVSEDDTSEGGSSIKDDDIFSKNDDALSNLKTEFENQQKEIREQREKVDELQSKVKHLEKEDDKKQNGLKRLEGDYRRLKEQSKGQVKEVEQLRSTVADLEAKVDQLKKHTDKEEDPNKTHLEEVERLSSLLTSSMEEIKSLKSSSLHQSPAGVSPVATTGGEAPESVEDVSSNGSKPSTTRTSHIKTETSTAEPLSIPCGLYGTTNSGPSSPLDGRQASLKRKASVQASPSPTPTRSFTVGGALRSYTPRTPSNLSSSFKDRTYGKTDPRRKEHKGRQLVIKKETPEKETPKKDQK
ncbi:hypothetical protein F25303_8995 [Fusarium sp. NRRL 25303]|nr:hypothetical protein F25303_8995 [Fusarium sp. NRRL 25303]